MTAQEIVRKSGLFDVEDLYTESGHLICMISDCRELATRGTGSGLRYAVCEGHSIKDAIALDDWFRA